VRMRKASVTLMSCKSVLIINAWERYGSTSSQVARLEEEVSHRYGEDYRKENEKMTSLSMSNG